MDSICLSSAFATRYSICVSTYNVSAVATMFNIIDFINMFETSIQRFGKHQESLHIGDVFTWVSRGLGAWERPGGSL